MRRVRRSEIILLSFNVFRQGMRIYAYDSYRFVWLLFVPILGSGLQISGASNDKYT
jgi:hypothetical protein